METPRPIRPKPTAMSQPFWDGARVGELRLQCCSGCGAHRFYPSAGCHKCGDDGYDWRAVPGRGHVYTWTVIRRALDPAFQARVPFTVAVVALDVAGRPLLPGTMLDCAPEDLRADMAVDIAFEPYDDDISLPCWRPAGEPEEEKT